MTETDTRLLQSLRLLLRPLANLLLKNRVGIAPVIKQLKLAYVEAARDNHGRKGAPASVNRISTLTGMSRNHVGELLAEVKTLPSADQLTAPIESEILAEWISNDAYVDNRGVPHALELGPGEGSFHSLVTAIAGDSDALQMVDRLVRSGSVKKRVDGKFEIAHRVFPINHDLPRVIAITLSPVASTIDKNWGRGMEDSMVLRVAHSGRVDSRKIAVIRRIAKERSSQFMEEIDDMLNSHQSEPGEVMTDPEGMKLADIGVSVCYFEREK